MKSISLNGESYVKASVIARELGYTADYVGQLCRSGKVDSQLVGRSWYVNPEALKGHKQSRYRSSAAKSKSQITQVLTKEASSGQHVVPTKRRPLEIDKHFYGKSNSADVEYVADEEELFPSIKKNGSDQTELGVKPSSDNTQTKNISPSSSNQGYDMSFSRPETVPFSGVLAVSDAKAESDLHTVNDALETERSTDSGVSKSDDDVVSHTSKFEDQRATKRAEISFTPSAVVYSNGPSLFSKVQIFLLVFLATLFALTFFILFLSIEKTAVVTETSLSIGYQLNLEHFFGWMEDLIAFLKSFVFLDILS